MTKVKYKMGIKKLLKEGWNLCPNKYYLEKDGKYWHWNTCMKKWVFN